MGSNECWDATQSHKSVDYIPWMVICLSRRTRRMSDALGANRFPSSVDSSYCSFATTVVMVVVIVRLLQDGFKYKQSLYSHQMPVTWLADSSTVEDLPKCVFVWI